MYKSSFMLRRIFYFAGIFSFSFTTTFTQTDNPRTIENFGKSWRFHLGDISDGQNPTLNDSSWRVLNVPHDWSIEGEFSKNNPATAGGGALPGGIGWYRKSFSIPESKKK